MKTTLLAAALTGVFCAGFSLLISYATEALTMQSVTVLAFVSGFCGSLFARLLMGRG